MTLSPFCDIVEYSVRARALETKIGYDEEAQDEALKISE
jgi:hypothetical protein